MQDFLDDLDQLYSRTREYEHNGYKFLLTVADPYGFWTAQVLRVKKQPEFTAQQFTNFPDCKRACQIWAESAGAIPADTEEAPKITYKKPRIQAK